MPERTSWVAPCEPRGPRREREAAFQLESADLVDQRRATLHQSVAHPVHGLPIELLLRFDLHKAHVLLGHGFGDRFRIDEVVLVRLALGFDELPRDKPHLVRPTDMCVAAVSHSRDPALLRGCLLKYCDCI